MTPSKVCRACVHCRVDSRPDLDRCRLTDELCENRRAQNEDDGGCGDRASDFRPTLFARERDPSVAHSRRV